MTAAPPAKCQKLADGEEAGGNMAESAGDNSELLCFTARKSAAGAAETVDFSMAHSSSVADLIGKIATHESCDPAQITLICKGAVLKPAALLSSLIEKKGADGKILVVYLQRKAAGAAKAAAAPSAPVTSTDNSTAAAATKPAAAAPAAASSSPQPAPAPAAAVTASTAATAAAPAATAEELPCRRVLLLLRHGQCCHDDDGSDSLKALTRHGHLQAEASAAYVAKLFEAGCVPPQRALLHSTSRRARETAAKLPSTLPELEVWNADLLRETDPTKNPLRAEEVFQRIFVAPPVGVTDTLIVVAHNNIILYLLMRSAGVPIERACQAWALFHLQHASLTRVDVIGGKPGTENRMQIISVGAAGHIPRESLTWHNVGGADLSEWAGGGPDRHKLSGRTCVLVRQAASSGTASKRQIEVVAAHIKGLSECMVSSHMMVACTAGAERTANEIARKFRTVPNVLPEDISVEPEAAFLQYVVPPTAHSRDTVVMVAEDGPVLYWLLRALNMMPEEATAAAKSYCIGHASITLVNVKSSGAMRVVAVGDTGHIPLDCI